MSEFKSSNFRNEDGSAAPDIVGVTTFTSPHYFNTDIGRLEVWRGDHWATILGESPNLGVNGALGARGIVLGGYNSTSGNLNTIEYVTISTLGNTQDFGDLLRTNNSEGCASSTRGLSVGGFSPSGSLNNIDFITIASTGNAQDFGDRTSGGGFFGTCSNSTRGVFAGAYIPTTNIIDYVTISSIGNAVDFGDLTQNQRYRFTGTSSSTRGVFSGGNVPSYINVINYLTISTTGNTQDFGDLSIPVFDAASCSNSTRSIISVGVFTNLQIDYITIATTGNSQNFGNLLVNSSRHKSVSSPTRGVIFGGETPSLTNAIQYVTILTTGNAQDFGDLSVETNRMGACSNAHGGL
jgi:hypothetical protein